MQVVWRLLCSSPVWAWSLFTWGWLALQHRGPLRSRSETERTFQKPQARLTIWSLSLLGKVKFDFAYLLSFLVANRYSNQWVVGKIIKISSLNSSRSRKAARCFHSHTTQLQVWHEGIIWAVILYMIYIMLHNLLQGNFSLPLFCSHSLSYHLETGGSPTDTAHPAPLCWCQESEGPKACAASYERKNVTWELGANSWAEHVSTTEASDILEWSFMPCMCGLDNS